jgi:ribosome-binding factor A
MNITPHRVYRDQQLSDLIEQELQDIFEEAEDPVLNCLEILSIGAKPGGKNFTVVVGAASESLGYEQRESHEEIIMEAIERARHYIRAEIALGLNLKRCPDLKFIPVVSREGVAQA